jgi:hypothetical protein
MICNLRLYQQDLQQYKEREFQHVNLQQQSNLIKITFLICSLCCAVGDLYGSHAGDPMLPANENGSWETIKALKFKI